MMSSGRTFSGSTSPIFSATFSAISTGMRLHTARTRSGLFVASSSSLGRISSRMGPPWKVLVTLP